VCANLANLLLARATTREREIAVRLALGASRPQLIRQLLAESIISALIGASLGAVAAVWSADLVARALPLPIAIDPSPDLRVAAFAIGLGVVTGIAFGLVPALYAVRLDLVRGMKIGPGTSGERARARVRSGLVVAQVALSFVLLVGGALFVRSLQRVTAVPIGFDTHRTLVMSLDLRPRGYTPERGRQLYDALLGRLRAAPGVASASMAAIVPLSGSRRAGSLEVEGAAPPADGRTYNIDTNVVTPGWFATLGIPLLGGRDFSPQDATGSPPFVIVNDAFVRRFWPDGRGVGRRLRRGPNEPWMEVVGVVGDIRFVSVGTPAVPMFFQPAAQRFDPRMKVFLRARGDDPSLGAMARAAVRGLDPAVSIPAIDRLDALYARSIGQYSLVAALVGGLGALALLLAAIGLYGVLSFIVAQETRNIGIRMALGARAEHVVRGVAAGGTRLVAIGVAIGVVAGLAVTRLASKFLFEVSPADPVSFLAAGLVLLIAALLASYVPARRATRVDPVTALRAE
jgi:predicted permease